MDPRFDVVKRFFVGDVVQQQDPHGTTVVGSGNGSESFLTGSIPEKWTNIGRVNILRCISRYPWSYLWQDYDWCKESGEMEGAERNGTKGSSVVDVPNLEFDLLLIKLNGPDLKVNSCNNYAKSPHNP